jgi:hypothetical protein
VAQQIVHQQHRDVSRAELMKIIFPNGNATRKSSGMTLVEMMTAMSIFIVLMAGMLAIHMFGLRYDQITGSRLGASDQARQSFDKLLGDVRAAKSIAIGTNYNATNFVAVPSGSNLVGTALKVGFSKSTNIIIYYFDTGVNKLFRYTNGVPGYKTLAANLTNTYQFTGEDYQGNILTGLDNHSVVGVRMEFYEFYYPLTKVGSNYLYDYYKLEFKASSRNFD